MTRRLLVVEPDAAARTMLDRVLTIAGYTVDEFESAHHARILLDDQAFDLAVVDEFAGGGAPLSEVRFLREHYPRLPVIVTGTLLTARELLELLRLGVPDALPKPFTPAELRDAVARVWARESPGHTEALEYAAAVASACDDLANGRVARAAKALARAYAVAPLDPEVAALEAFRAEVEGRDSDAARGYRAVLALRHDESNESLDPHEGLARIAAYGSARPVPALTAAFANAPLWIVSDPVHELPAGPPDAVGSPYVVVLGVGLLVTSGGSVHLRESTERAFAVLPSALRPEQIASSLARLSSGPAVARQMANGVDLVLLASLRAAILAKDSRPSVRP